MKKFTVTIAIPAYNEELVINRALSSLMSQNKTRYILQSIRVFSDGSSDKTVALAKSFSKKVQVKDFKKNLGKLTRVNQILKENTSDILILMDADVILRSKSTVDALVRVFEKGKSDLVFANHIAKRPKTFIGRVSYFGYSVWNTTKKKLGVKGIRYYAEGGLVAFSRDFADMYRLPKSIVTGDDSYLFYRAIEMGYSVRIAKSAKVYIDLAENLSDYIRQMKRFLKDPQIVSSQFDEDLVRSYETMTTRKKLVTLISYLIKQPLVGTCYLFLQCYTKIVTPFDVSGKGWKPIERKIYA